MSGPLPRVLVALLVAIPAAGCLGIGAGDDGDEPGTPLNESTNSSTNATLPEGRGESAGLKETNKTEEGVGGVDHKHDYWKGKSMDVLLEAPAAFYSTPVYPDGDGSQAKSVAYVKLPPPKLVYEGAERVEVTATNPTIGVNAGSLEGVALETPRTAHPSPPNLFLQYRSARDSDWRDPVPLPYGTAVAIQVESQDTDMPHSVQSLWVFRVTTDRPILESPDVQLFTVDFLITAHKGREVVDWPGHPDFYADANRRVVLDTDVTTEMSGIQEGIMYDSGGTWVNPEKLISHGTTRLDVFMNVSGASNAYNAEPTGYFLEFHNATIVGPEIRFGNRSAEENVTEPLKSYRFSIPVDLNGMDGPYQPQSRWGFRLMATFTDVDVPGVIGVGLCPGCFPYEISYRITVVAWGDPEVAPIGA